MAGIGGTPCELAGGGKSVGRRDQDRYAATGHTGGDARGRRQRGARAADERHGAGYAPLPGEICQAAPGPLAAGRRQSGDAVQRPGRGVEGVGHPGRRTGVIGRRRGPRGAIIGARFAFGRRQGDAARARSARRTQRVRASPRRSGRSAPQFGCGDRTPGNRCVSRHGPAGRLEECPRGRRSHGRCGAHPESWTAEHAHRAARRSRPSPGDHHRRQRRGQRAFRPRAWPDAGPGPAGGQGSESRIFRRERTPAGHGSARRFRPANDRGGARPQRSPGEPDGGGRSRSAGQEPAARERLVRLSRSDREIAGAGAGDVRQGIECR